MHASTAKKYPTSGQITETTQKDLDVTTVALLH